MYPKEREVMKQIFKILVLTMLFLVSGSSAYGTPTKPSWDCAAGLKAELNTSLRISSADAARPIYFEVPEPGLLVLDIVGRGGGNREPVLSFSEGCDRPPAERRTFESLMRSPAHWMLAVQRPGRLQFEIKADFESGRDIGDYRLRADFVPVEPLTKEDEEILEIEPETFREPDPTRGPDLCGRGEVDDHADIFPCATPLEPSVEVGGDLFTPWGDDVDVFTFELDPSHELWSVLLNGAGDGELHGILFDEQGLRLEQSLDQADDSFGLARALPPGRYFVRIEGRNLFRGQYELRLEATRI